MKKSDISAHVAAETSLSRADATSAVDAVLSAISDALARGEPVSISGFGSFSVEYRPERRGRNLRTGERVTIAASKMPSFTAEKGLRDAVGQVVVPAPSGEISVDSRTRFHQGPVFRISDTACTGAHVGQPE